MRALITGGKGFVGQWLASHLKDCGDEVVVIAAPLRHLAEGAHPGKAVTSARRHQGSVPQQHA